MDNPKIERMLQLLMLLANNYFATINDIVNKLGMSSRTIYRYIDTFRNMFCLF